MTNIAPDQRLEEIIDMIRSAYAPNTIRAYRADMEEFIRYCEGRQKSAIPADHATVAEFLISTINQGIRSATIRRKVASISAIHRLGEYLDPTKHPQVKLALRKVHRQLGTRYRQAYPITESLLRKLVAVCGVDIRGKRDKALLMLAYDSMRRRSEIVSLRVEDIERQAGGLISILLRKSKTDQDGTGQWIHLGRESSDAINEWLSVSKITDGYVLRSIDSRGNVRLSLSPGQVGRVFKNLSKQVGLPVDVIKSVSGHSMRVGGAQDLLVKGASLPQIMVKGGWVKTDTVIRYIERVRTNPMGLRS